MSDVVGSAEARVVAATHQRVRDEPCSCPHCGYLVYVAPRHLDSIGPPECPVHGLMVRGKIKKPKKPAEPRRQRIRDAILAFLSEPRSASAVARHIDRPVPVATGHLAAMRRRGLVQRIGFAAYALAGYAGPPLSFPKRLKGRPAFGTVTSQ